MKPLISILVEIFSSSNRYMMRNLTHRFSLALVGLGLAVTAPLGGQSLSADQRAIQDVVTQSYVHGVFVTRNAEAVRRGFHPDFTMSVNSDGQIIQASLDMWLDRMGLDGTPSGDAVEPTFDRIDVTGSTAWVKLQLMINGEHVYTDHLGLYRLADGWRIVTKVFESH